MDSHIVVSESHGDCVGKTLWRGRGKNSNRKPVFIPLLLSGKREIRIGIRAVRWGVERT